MAIFLKDRMKEVVLIPPATPPAGQYPSTAYGNSPVHVGVHYSKNPVIGSKVWLSMSPYIGYNDDFENPCIYRSDDSVTEDFATKFIPYNKNPLVGKPGEPDDLSFNADPDVITEDGVVHIINRPVINKNTTTLEKDWYVDYFKTTDFVEFTPPVRIYGGLFNGIDNLAIASPAIVFWNNNFRIYDLVTTSWNSVEGYCYGMRIMDSPTMGLNSHSSYTFGRFYGYKLEPWHMSVFEYNGKLYSIVCAKTRGFNGADSGRIYLGIFDDTGTNLYIFRKPLTDFRTYRSDAYVRDDGVFVLYASMFDEPYGGINNARRILADAMDFEKLLSRVRR